jgi:branched-chain amino acid transport system ATP-binding protein
MMTVPILQLQGLSEGFGGVTVLRGVDLTLRPGERRGLIGPNGAGKTTLINLITGGLQADSGRILLRGKPMTSLPPHKRSRLGIGRSFQILSLFGGMTVLENIRNAILRHRGLETRVWRRLSRIETVQAEAAHYAALVGLRDALHEHVETLPYGMQRRLDIALVLAQEPELIILDEPAAGLSAAETRDLIAVLQAVIGARTLLLVEHDMDVVYALSDRITVLDYGRVLAEGAPADVNANAEVRRVYLGEAAD